MTVQKAMIIHERRLFAIGLAKVHRYERLYRFYSALMVGIVLFIQCYTYPVIFYVDTHQARSEGLTFAVMSTLLQLKIVLFSFNRRRIDSVLEIMHGMEASIQRIDERQPIELAANRTSQLVSSAWIMSQLVIITRFVQSFLYIGNVNRELMFPAFFPVAWRTNDAWYVSCNCFIFVMTMVCAFGMCSLDSFGPTMYMLLDAFVEILSARMRRIGEQCEEDADDDANQRRTWAKSMRQRTEDEEAKCERELLACIEMHQECLKYV